MERSPSSCCRIPDSCYSGAWWEKPVHRGFHGENFSHRKTDHIRKIPQLRTDLRCPGLYPLRCFCSKPAASGTGKEIHRQFGKQPLQNPDYGKIINEKHFHRLQNLIAADKLVCGGGVRFVCPAHCPDHPKRCHLGRSGHGRRNFRTDSSGTYLF